MNEETQNDREDKTPQNSEFLHNNKMNMLFTDGHVETLGKAEVPYRYTTLIKFSKPWY